VEAAGDRAEEVAAGDDPHEAALVRHGHQQHAVVQEDLGDAEVGEVLIDVDVLRVHVAADRLGPALLALLERLVQAPAHEARGLELPQIAREDGAQELPLAEYAGEPVAVVEHRQRRQVGCEQRPGRLHDGVAVAQGRGLAHQRRADLSRAHGLLLTGTGRRCRRWPAASRRW
jgi:hypothetical protein